VCVKLYCRTHTTHCRGQTDVVSTFAKDSKKLECGYFACQACYAKQQSPCNGPFAGRPCASELKLCTATGLHKANVCAECILVAKMPPPTVSTGNKPEAVSTCATCDEKCPALALAKCRALDGDKPCNALLCEGCQARCCLNGCGAVVCGSNFGCYSEACAECRKKPGGCGCATIKTVACSDCEETGCKDCDMTECDGCTERFCEKCLKKHEPKCTSGTCVNCEKAAKGTCGEYPEDWSGPDDSDDEAPAKPKPKPCGKKICNECSTKCIGCGTKRICNGHEQIFVCLECKAYDPSLFCSSDCHGDTEYDVTARCDNCDELFCGECWDEHDCATEEGEEKSPETPDGSTTGVRELPFWWICDSSTDWL
jgi:hypothetical protein